MGLKSVWREMIHYHLFCSNFFIFHFGQLKNWKIDIDSEAKK